MSKMTISEINRIDRLKNLVGIKRANCESCKHLANESDGNYGEYQYQWRKCKKNPHFSNLKTFPFHDEQKCWEPNFWHSKFANGVNES